MSWSSLVPSARWSTRSSALLLAVALLPILSVGTARADDTDTVVGELVQAWPEFEDPGEAVTHAAEGPLSWIEPEQGDAVRVATEDVDHLAPGATVEVTLGDEAPDVAEAEGMEPAREVLATEVLEVAPTDPPDAAPAAITNQVTVVMVRPAGTAQDTTTLADVVAAVDGPVADFWAQESNGAVTVAVTGQVDWPATAYAASCSDPTALWDEAQARSSFVPGSGKHLLLYVPRSATTCPYGLAEVGWGLSDGGRLMVRDTAPSVLAHELGHNFSLEHSSGQQCDGRVDTGSCRVVPYRDYYDVMGVSWSEIGSLNPVQADALGFLATPERTVVTHTAAARSISLPAYGNRAGARAVALVAGDGDVYWLEYRAPVGQDAWLADPARNWTRLQSGVLLRRATTPADPSYRNDGSLLLDPTPSRASGWGGDVRTAFPLGVPVTVAGGDFVVTVTGAGAGAAQVEIEPGNVGRARLPLGALDGVSMTGPNLAVRGWALDLNAPTRPVDVHVYVDGRAVVTHAAAYRPDVSRAYPAAGARHGFSFATKLAPGGHVVCAYAIDTAGRGNTALGCRGVTYVPRRPSGSLDGVTLTGSTVTAGGWAVDTDTPATAVQVHLYLDGRATALTANRSRADVSRAFPGAGSAHGFSFSTALAPGSHELCAYALDTSGAGSTPLGCRTLRYSPRLPTGSLDGVSVTGGVLSVVGWAVDADTPTVSGRVHLYVDRSAVALTADRGRADIGRALPAAGSAHGFSWSGPLTAGSHRVCAYALDTGGAGSTLLGCRTVTA